jgi:hypothetical protein
MLHSRKSSFLSVLRNRGTGPSPSHNQALFLLNLLSAPSLLHLGGIEYFYIGLSSSSTSASSLLDDDVEQFVFSKQRRESANITSWTGGRWMRV